MDKHKYKLCKLNNKEFLGTRELYREVFMEDSPRFVDYYYEVKSQSSTALVLKNEDGEIISMLHLNPYEISVRNGNSFQSIPSYYIVAVATRQSYRHRGCMARLLEEAESFCREKSVPFLFLMPADPKIYHPFGYEYIFSRPEFSFVEDWQDSKIRLSRYYMNSGRLVESSHTEEANAETPNTDAKNTDAKNADAKNTDTENSGKEQLGQDKTSAICRQLAEFAQSTLEQQFDFFVKRNERYYVNLIKELEAQNGEIGIYSYQNQIVGYYTKTGEEPNLFCGEDGIVEALFAEEFMTLCKQAKRLPIVPKQEKHPIIMGKLLDMSGERERAKEGELKERALKERTLKELLPSETRGWIIEIV